jgi:hypothetical protein
LEREGLVSRIKYFVPIICLVLYSFARRETCAGQTCNLIIACCLTEPGKFQHKRVAGGTRPKKPVRKSRNWSLVIRSSRSRRSKPCYDLQALFEVLTTLVHCLGTTRRLKDVYLGNSRLLLGDGLEFGVRLVQSWFRRFWRIGLGYGEVSGKPLSETPLTTQVEGKCKIAPLTTQNGGKCQHR